MTTTSTTTTATYRKTKTGEWVAFAPAASLAAGQPVTVTKRSGETVARLVDRAGKPFTVDGVEMAYGYLVAEGAAASSPKARVTGYGRRGGGYSRRACITGGNCSSFGDSRSCGGHDCDGFE